MLLLVLAAASGACDRAGRAGGLGPGGGLQVGGGKEPAADSPRGLSLDEERSKNMAIVMAQPIYNSAPSPQPASVAAGSSEELGDAARAQNALLAHEAKRSDRERGMETTLLRMQEQVDKAFTKLYAAAKGSGVRFSAVEDELREVNAGRRTSGVWELRVGKSIDGNAFVLVHDFMRVQPTFAVQGAGTFTASGYLRDSEFEATGSFAQLCMYEVYLANRSLGKYECKPFLEGELDDRVYEDMKKVFTSSLSRK